MGFKLKEEMNNEEQDLPKKKSKKKNRDSVLESGEIQVDSSPEKENGVLKIGKSKKKYNSVFPQEYVEENSDSPRKKKGSLSKSFSSIVGSGDAGDMKKKKKKKDREPINDIDDCYPVSCDEIEKEVDIDETLQLEDENEDVTRHLENEQRLPQDDDFYEGWPKEDLKELFMRMEQAIPKNDSFKASSRIQKLDWEQIKFNNYTAAECQEKWKYVEKKLRGFRLLGELLSDANSWLDKPWTDFYRSGKKNRHPGLPKRPLTSFMLFYMDKKKKFAKKYPNLEMSKLSKIMAEKFRSLSESKREKYKRLALEMRQDYNEKMQKFLEEHPSEAVKVKKSLKSKKEKGTVSGPKKPVTPFKMFYLDKVKRLKEDGEPVPAEFLTECKEKWKDMSNRKKMPWIRWAHEAEVKYLEEVKLYMTENTNFEPPPFKSVLSKAEKEILDRVEGKPEKPPNSAYSLFSRLMLKDPNIKQKFETPKQRLQEIARLWKEVPKIEREEYAEKVKHLLENYKLEYATYLDSLPEDKREEELASNIPKKKIKIEGAVSLPKKKLKQTLLTPLQNTPEPKKNLLFIDKDKRTKTYTEEELMLMEPPEPPTEPFIFFRDEYLKQGLSEKKALKAWGVLSNFEKKNYEQKLEAMKQEYLTNYRTFLKSLKPEELKLYSQLKEKKKKEELHSEDEEDEEAVNEEEDEEKDEDSSINSIDEMSD